MYFLYRISKYMDEPYRSHAQQALRNTFRFHGFAVPVFPKPLVLPFLAHPTFKASLKKFLKDAILTEVPNLVPLHWPSSCQCQEGRVKRSFEC